jgi:heme A synthase
VVAGLLALGGLVQAASIAFAWFQSINELEDGLVIDENFEGNVGHATHQIVGFMALPALGLILLIVSFFAAKTVPGARKWGGTVFGLIVLQVVLAIGAFALAPIIGALHGLNALLIIAAAGRASALGRDASVAGTLSIPGQRSESTSGSGSSLPV